MGAGEAQAELVAAAGAMPVLGPNCYGVVNALDRVALWPDQHGLVPVERGVAILSQSSNIAINLTMQRRGLPIGIAACLGNAAAVGLADLAGAMLADDRVTALGLYIEGIDDAVALADVAEEAHAMGKGIVALKAGKTEAGRAAAASHTAALAGGGAASTAYLAQTGIAEVATLDGLIEALKLMHAHGPRLGKRIASMSCSGGEAGLVADMAAKHPILEFPAPDATALSALLGPVVSPTNPLDYQTFIWGDRAAMAAVFAQMMTDVDVGIVVIDPPRSDRCDPSSFEPTLEAIADAAEASGKPVLPVASMPEGIEEARALALMAKGRVPLCGLAPALEALAALAAVVVPDGWRPYPARTVGDSAILDEVVGKALLAEFEVDVPKGVSGTGLDLDIRALKSPLALKGLGFAHKTEAGAVRLNLDGLAGQAPMPGAQGYLVEEMVSGGLVEVLVGCRRDPVYGVTVTLGMGGVLAELLADTVTLVAPVTAQDIQAALHRLKLAPLLLGYRGAAAPDVVTAVQAILAVQRALDSDATLQEIEINPLILTADRAVAVDALIRKDCST